MLVFKRLADLVQRIAEPGRYRTISPPGFIQYVYSQIGGTPLSKKRILLIGLLVVGMAVVGIEAAVLGLSRDTASEEASRVATRTLSGTADAVAAGVKAAASGPGQNGAAPAPGTNGIDGAESQRVPTLTQLAHTAVQPDPDYKNALTRAGISTRGWKTDFSLHTVPYDEILSGGPPRDGIPPIDNPSLICS